MYDKIKTLEELQVITSDLKSKGKKVVHCHGVFDLLHIGHIKYFEEAKSFGDVLVVFWWCLVVAFRRYWLVLVLSGSR